MAWQRAGSPTVDGVETWKDLSSFPESGYHAPYRIQYWEVGNEIWLHYYNRGLLNSTSAATYRNSFKAYSEAMRKANDENGELDPITKLEQNPYGGVRLKIGASLDGMAALNSPNPGLSSWDEWVLTPDIVFWTDFASTHPYTHPYPDQRHECVLSAGTPELQTMPTEDTLQPGATYTFRVRVRPDMPGTQTSNLAEFPIMQVLLAPVSPPQTQEELAYVISTEGGWNEDRRYQGSNMVYVRNPWDRPSNEQDFTGCEYWYEEPLHDYFHYRNDYTFTATVPQNAQQDQYRLILKLVGNPGKLQVSLVTYQKGTVQAPDGIEKPIQFRDTDDQTTAVFAAPILHGIRLAALREWLDGISATTGKHIEIACTEYRALFGWAYAYPQDASMKAVINIADMLRVMMEQDVEVANLFMLKDMIVEGRHNYPWDVIHGCHYNHGEGKLEDLDTSEFFAPAPQRLFKLLGEHFGERKLPAAVSTGVGVLPPPASMYGEIANINVPCISAVASGSGESEGHFEKVFVLLINKDSHFDRPTTIRLDGLKGTVTDVRWHVLACDPAIPDALDAVNEFLAPNRIDIAESSEVISPFAAGPVDLVHTLPKASVTVLEVTVGGAATLAHLGDAPSLCDGWNLTIAGNRVTAIFADRFYIEDPDRIAGLAVNGCHPELALGDTVNIIGVLTTVGGERMIDPTNGSVTKVSSGDPLAALGMQNMWLGGAAPSAYTPEIFGGFGLYNVGLLVQTWGKVTAVPGVSDPSKWFYVDDGALLNDCSTYAGVLVLVPDSYKGLPALGAFVLVTGISGSEPISGSTGPARRLVRVRTLETGSDIAVPTGQAIGGDLILNCWNMLGLRGIPVDPTPEEVFTPQPGHPAIPLDGNLKRYDLSRAAWLTYNSCGTNLFGNCLVGDGLQLNFLAQSGAGFTFQGVDCQADIYVSLPRGSSSLGEFAFVANPMASGRLWSSCWVTDGHTELPVPDAIGTTADKWIWRIEQWNGGWTEVTDLNTGCMEAGKGYKVYPRKGDLALVIPKP